MTTKTEFYKESLNAGKDLEETTRIWNACQVGHVDPSALLDAMLHGDRLKAEGKCTFCEQPLPAAAGQGETGE